MRGKHSIRLSGATLALGIGLAVAAGILPAEGQAPAQTPAQVPVQSGSDNPFPGDAPKPAQNQAPKAGTPAKPAATSDNPFPGEDSNAPIIPVDGNPATAPDSGNAPRPGSQRPQYDSSRAPGSSSSSAGNFDGGTDDDPVHSPDLPGSQGDDSFSSSREGLKPDLAESATEKDPGSSQKTKTRAEVLKEDIDIGGFYLSKKDWKGALGRFQSAFALDNEDPDAVWGLAEAERHMQLYAKSVEHYKLFLSYDPDGPHSREARKALQQVEAQPQAPNQLSNQSISPK